MIWGYWSQSPEDIQGGPYSPRETLFKHTQSKHLKSLEQCRHCCCLVVQSCLTLVTPWAEACQAPLSVGFPKQECWSQLPFPSPGMESTSPDNARGFFTTEPPGKPSGQALFLVPTLRSSRCLCLPTLRFLYKVKAAQSCPWDSSGQNTGVDSGSLLQVIFPTQGWALQGDSLPAEPPGKPKRAFKWCGMNRRSMLCCLPYFSLLLLLLSRFSRVQLCATP